jgi:hypothetical protein
MVTPALFARYPDARALAAAAPAELEPQILSPASSARSRKALVTMAQILVREHRGEVPADMEALTKLPGVGRKTANVVLGHALGVPGLPVDRHVLRVANRIGIAEGDDPVAVEAQLGARLPPSLWDARLRRPDSPRPPHLPADKAALRPVPGGRRLPLLRGAVARDPRHRPGGAPEADGRAQARLQGRGHDQGKDLGCRTGPAPQVNRA